MCIILTLPASWHVIITHFFKINGQVVLLVLSILWLLKVAKAIYRSYTCYGFYYCINALVILITFIEINLSFFRCFIYTWFFLFSQWNYNPSHLFMKHLFNLCRNSFVHVIMIFFTYCKWNVLGLNGHSLGLLFNYYFVLTICQGISFL